MLFQHLLPQLAESMTMSPMNKPRDILKKPFSHIHKQAKHVKHSFLIHIHHTFIQNYLFTTTLHALFAAILLHKLITTPPESLRSCCGRSPFYLLGIRRSRHATTPGQVREVETRRGSYKRQSDHVMRLRCHLSTCVRPKPYPCLLIGRPHFRNPLVVTPPPNPAIHRVPRLLEFLPPRVVAGLASGGAIVGQ
jgi:hypothetical protein